MSQPRISQANDAPFLRYERSQHGLDAISRMVITGAESDHMALNLVTIEPPVDYASTLGSDVIVYFLEGAGTLTVGDEQYEYTPGAAILIPHGLEHHHVSSVRNAFLVIWSPPPPDTPRHRLEHPEVKV